MNHIIGKKYRVTPTSYINQGGIEISKKVKRKISDEQFRIPDIANYEYILQFNFKVSQLKRVCKHHKLKQSGKKDDLVKRIYSFLRISNACMIIQKATRRFFYKQYKRSQGPGRDNRSICVNETDFLTMEDLKDIGNTQFFSITDQTGHVYGFDVISLWNLYLKNGQETTNPYNRLKFSENIYHTLCIFLNYSQILKKDVILIIKNEEDENMTPEKRNESRTLTLFQLMDDLGNYTDITWFLNLNSYQIIKFIRELMDIWYYRAQLTDDVKREICPPLGNPFCNININMLNTGWNIQELRKFALNIIDRMVTSGINSDNQSLGTIYVLSALTLVNTNAANALPWLYQSVSPG